MKRIATIDTKQDDEATEALKALKTYSRDTPKDTLEDPAGSEEVAVVFGVSFVNSSSQQDYRQFDTPQERAAWIAENAPHCQRHKLLEVPRLATADEVSLLIAARDL